MPYLTYLILFNNWP